MTYILRRGERRDGREGLNGKVQRIIFMVYLMRPTLGLEKGAGAGAEGLALWAGSYLSAEGGLGMLLYFLLPTAVPGRLRIAQLHGRCSGPSKMQPFVHIGFTRLGYGYLLGRRRKQRQDFPPSEAGKK